MSHRRIESDQLHQEQSPHAITQPDHVHEHEGVWVLCAAENHQ